MARRLDFASKDGASSRSALGSLEGHGHRRSFAERALDIQHTAEILHQGFDNRKPKPGAGLRQIRLVAHLSEGFADPGDGVDRDADARVGDADQIVSEQVRRLDRDRTVNRCELDRVGEQVKQNLRRRPTVGADRQRVGDRRHRQNQALLRQRRGALAAGVIQDGADANRRQIDDARAGLDLRQGRGYR